MMGRKKSLLREALEDLRKQIIQEIRELGDRIPEEEMKPLEKKRTCEEMTKERRNAKVEEGREKVIAKSDVARIAVSGSRTSETEAEIHFWCRGCWKSFFSKNATIAGIECIRKAIKLSSKK